MFIVQSTAAENAEQHKSELTFPPEFRFDSQWYIQRYPSVKLAVNNGVYPDAYRHFTEIGRQQGFQPSPYFSAQWVEQQLDLAEVLSSDDCRHDYLNYQLTHTLSPHWLFDEHWYRSCFPDVEDALEQQGLCASFIAYVRWVDQNKVRPSALFSSAFFLQHNQLQPTDKAFNAFLLGSFPADVRTSPLFDPEYYLQCNPAVAHTVHTENKCSSLIEHFCRIGMAQNLPFLADFDAEYYYQNNRSEIEESEGLNACQHFFQQGIYQNLSPNPYFDPDYYIQRQPEVIEESQRLGLSGVFEHFLTIGSARQYVCRAPLVSLPISDELGKSLFDKRARLAAQNVFASNKPLYFPQHDEVDVSCVIPVFNKADYTYSLLRQLSLIANEDSGPRLEVIVVDNGSTDRVTELEQRCENLVVIKSEAPLGYTKACNMGAAVASGTHILFMNNDIEVLPDAITFAHETMSSNDIGAVGGRIVLTNGLLQEAGSTIWRDGSAKGNGRGENPEDPKFLFRRDVDYCSGCFLMVKADVFRACDGFSEEYCPGYYEDADLCARIWSRGLRVVYDPRVVLTHYEYASFSSGRPPSMSRSMIERHRAIFRQRNREFLAQQEEQHAGISHYLSDRADSRSKHVFIFDDLLPDPAFGSGFTRAFAIVESFISMGWRVTVWASYERGSGIDQHLQSIGVNVLSPLRCKEPINQYFAEHYHDIDVFWCARTHNFKAAQELALSVIDKKQRPRFIADSEAIASLRDSAYNALLGVKSDATELDNNIRFELGDARHLDSIVVVNWLDKVNVERAINRPTHTIGLRETATHAGASFEERKHILFCGAVHELKSPNLDSLLWYIRHVHPLVLDAMPDIQLEIMGYWAPSLTIPSVLKNTPGVVFHGTVSDNTLKTALREARVFVAPTRYAGGVAQKVHSAMANGLPCVTSPLISKQLPDDHAEPQVLAPAELCPQEFAALVVQLYGDDAVWNGLHRRGLDYIDEHCSAQRFTELVKLVAEEACNDEG